MSKSKPASPERKLFAQRLATIRASAGYVSMAAFAQAIGVEDETYRRYERAETEPSITVLAKIRALTGVSLDFLVAGDPRATGNGRPFIPDESSHSPRSDGIGPNTTGKNNESLDITAAGGKPAGRKRAGRR